MAGSSKRFTFAAVVLPFLFLMMAGSARALPPTVITVNTTFGGSVIAVPGPCSLTDAVAAANAGTTVQNCTGGTGANEIEFAVTGTITLGATLDTTTSDLAIIGPTGGGITISGGNTQQIIDIEAGSLTLENLTFADGFAADSGGAISDEGNDLTIENCSFTGNTAGSGGAINFGSGTATITNSTFADNSATTDGGAIFNNNTNPLLLTNDTFWENNAAAGGALFAIFGSVTKYKATLFQTGSTGPNCAPSSSSVLQDIGFNISNDSSCPFTMGTSHVESPGLDTGGLNNNGGPTQTVALLSSSAAKTLDTNCTDQEATPEILTTDQRLFGRPNSPTSCSSGAYEFGAVAPIVISPTGERVQIARSSTAMSDQVNLSFSVTDNGLGNPASCNPGNDLINGIDVALFQGTCADLPALALNIGPFSFVSHTVNHQNYGTFFNNDSLGTVSARIVSTPPPADACGEWLLNVEVSGITTATFGLTGGSGPGTTYALEVEDSNGNFGCLDVTNAIVGGQINTPGRTLRFVRR
jgi:predicted outer membrane repeat protein